MINYISKSKRRLYRFFYLKKAEKKISILNLNGDPQLKLLYNALNDFFYGNISDEERIWINKVESLRKELNNSHKEITIVDFGVSKSDSEISEDHQRKGRLIKDSIGHICQTGSKSFFWCLLLFKLILKFKPKSCLELGSLLGISAAYQASALSINKEGKIVTLEGAESLAQISNENFSKLNLNNIKIITGRFQDTLESTAKNIAPIDYAFIDGHHDETATISYFNQLTPFLTENALLIFDDINWTEGMKKAWDNIIENEHIKAAIDLSQVGICIFSNKHWDKTLLQIKMV